MSEKKRIPKELSEKLSFIIKLQKASDHGISSIKQLIFIMSTDVKPLIGSRELQPVLKTTRPGVGSISRYLIKKQMISHRTDYNEKHRGGRDRVHLINHAGRKIVDSIFPKGGSNE